MSFYGIIYKTTNLINGNFYIGKTIRKGRKLEIYLGSGRILRKAILKYGSHSFEKEVLWTCDNEDQLNRMERLWIKLLSPNYNIAEGGEGGNTSFYSLEEKILKYEKSSYTWQHRPIEKKKEFSNIRRKIQTDIRNKESKEQRESRVKKWRETMANRSEDKKKLEFERRSKARRREKNRFAKKVLCVETGVVFSSMVGAAEIVYGHERYVCNIYRSIKNNKTVKYFTWRNITESEGKIC